MEIKIKNGQIEKESSGTIILGLFEGETVLEQETAAVDRALRGQIKDLMARGEFKGKHRQSLMLYSRGDVPARQILLVGLGKRKKITLQRIREILGLATCRIREAGSNSISTSLHGSGLNLISNEKSAQAIIEGAILGLYRFNAHRTEGLDEIQEIQEFTLVVPKEGSNTDAARGARTGEILARATNYARDLCNHPSNVVTPSYMAEEAETLARELDLTCRVIDKSEARSLGMGAFLGVAQGSQEPPKFIILEYHGGKKKDSPVVLVGKSVTFDSGGVSIKPAEKMELMKTDMSGGAAVLGTMRALAQLKLPVTVVGILPATENMPSGTAIKPGDVVKTMSGKTVEVINTDAEGRMILADALTYAARYKPSAIVDLATLTGACVVALGNKATGLLGTDAQLIERLKQAGERCGERVWELPLWEVYDDQIKSDVADMKNVGGRGGGTITAAAFLKKFVGDTPWAHLDIAGTSRLDESLPYIPKGSTGVGVRLLIEWFTEMTRARA